MAVRVAEAPKIARLAGARAEVLGIALFEGALIPVVSLSAAPVSPGGFAPPSTAAPAMVVCQHDGERVGLMGLEVVASGTFAPSPREGDEGVVLDDGRLVGAVDVGELYARLQGAGAGLVPGCWSGASATHAPLAPIDT